MIMDHNQLTIFYRNMQEGMNLEAVGNYKAAMFRYQYAYDIAKSADDTSYEDAQEAINRCKEKIKIREEREQSEREY